MCQLLCMRYQPVPTSTVRERYLQFTQEENRHFQDASNKPSNRFYSEIIQVIDLDNCYQWTLIGKGILEDTGEKNHSQQTQSLSQRPPTFLAPGIGFVEDNFPMERGAVGRWDGFRMTREHDIHYIQAHPLLFGLIPNRPRMAPVCDWRLGTLV